MKRYGITDALWMSFYSKPLYADVAYSWKGAGLIFLLMLTVFISLVFGAQINAGLQNFVHQEAPAIIAQIPEITISKGKISTPEARPYPIKDPKSGQLVAVIDAAREDIPGDLGGVYVFAVRSRVVVRKSEAETRIYDLDKIDHFVLNQKRMDGWLKMLGIWGTPAILPFVLFFFFIGKIAQALFFSLWTIFLCRKLQVSLRYRAVFRLTVVAMTPASFAGLLFDVAQLKLGVLVSALAAGFIYLAVRSAKDAPAGAPSDPGVL